MSNQLGVLIARQCRLLSILLLIRVELIRKMGLEKTKLVILVLAIDKHVGNGLGQLEFFSPPPLSVFLIATMRDRTLHGLPTWDIHLGVSIWPHC